MSTHNMPTIETIPITFTDSDGNEIVINIRKHFDLHIENAVQQDVTLTKAGMPAQGPLMALVKAAIVSWNYNQPLTSQYIGMLPDDPKSQIWKHYNSGVGEAVEPIHPLADEADTT